MAETLELEVSLQSKMRRKEESPRFMMTRATFSGVLFFYNVLICNS